ncbi:type I secretion system permease/ATPase [Roseovarius sp. MMSF_3281]|uniref:type I secretion system permease/ATPase n=1 Tax=Roseovarius sp. MMSF_3281 TaxID=3046694 RepID=UPI00273F6B8E|nr:type I secretion system permease/ATPase [Roseovarius sp. MMSF_3281]
MTGDPHPPGRVQLRALCHDHRGLLACVAVFSVFVNLLMLTGPLYMLQIYDRVLGSGSVESLIALTLLVVFLFGVMAVLDHARGRIMARIAARFHAGLERRVFAADLRQAARGDAADTGTGLHDLEVVRRALASPAMGALFDIPLTPLFVLGIWLFHPWLGMLALLGGGSLIALAVLNQWVTRAPADRAARAEAKANRIAHQFRQHALDIKALGMESAGFAQWQGHRTASLVAQVRASDMGGGFHSATKAYRLLLQSGMLGLGAYLVLHGTLSPGGMIAASILLGRALAPIEQCIAFWPLLQAARQGWGRLGRRLEAHPSGPPPMALPTPRARLRVEGISVIPPGTRHPTLRQVSFELSPGQALGVIGPSGSGKSTLAQALTGAWPAVAGTVRLDGAALDQVAPEGRARHLGYLPQRVTLFDATVGENIARLTLDADPAAIVDAAMAAGAHEMILGLPHGYDTPVTAPGEGLSGGQVQHIGLARALFGDPALLVLDEPNAQLDHEGCMAVTRAIHAAKANGKAVVVMAHRPAAIEACDLVLTLEGGVVRRFGPKARVLHEVVENHSDITKTAGAAS